MGLFDIFGKKGAGEKPGEGIPFKLETSMRPIRLKAMEANKTDLLIDLQNITGGELLVSVTVKVPEKIGFDSVGLSRVKEIRIGQMGSMGEKHLNVEIHGNNQTAAGDYGIDITAYSHYRDYGHILNSVKKKVILRVV